MLTAPSRSLHMVFAACVFLAAAAFSWPAASADSVPITQELAEDLIENPPEGILPAEVALAFGWFHLFGLLDNASPVQAEMYLLQALDAGLAEAGVVLGAMYIGNTEMAPAVVEKDIAKAVEFYERAAEGGSVDAMRMLGVLYSDGGEGVAADEKMARKYLMEAAARGSEAALQRLEPEIEQAAKWEEENPGQKADFPSTREDLVDPSLTEEARQRSSRVSEVTARILDICIARIAEQSAGSGVAPESSFTPEKQRELWQQIEKVVDLGADEILADQEDDQARGDTALVIGIFHYMGLLHGQDTIKARRFLEMADDLGVPEAKVTLGELFLGVTQPGSAVDRDIAKGLEYLQSAFAEDSVDAARLLGIVYSDGVDGLEPDHDKAVGYFAAAVRHGDEEAIRRLAILRQENPQLDGVGDLPEDLRDLVEPELAEAATERGAAINAAVERVNQEFEKKVIEAVRGGGFDLE